MRFTIGIEVPEPFAWRGTMSSEMNASQIYEAKQHLQYMAQKLIEADWRTQAGALLFLEDKGCFACRIREKAREARR